MIDSTTHTRITVHPDGAGGPYIVVPLAQLAAVEAMLRGQGISFSVDANAISVGGRPAVVFINLGRGADPGRVQRVLDAAA
jgi:hypothetical protein